MYSNKNFIEFKNCETLALKRLENLIESVHRPVQ